MYDLTTLCIDIVLPLTLARALETYCHDYDFGVLVLLADLIIPSKETVWLLLDICAPYCHVVLQIVSPLPTTGKEFDGATVLSKVVKSRFEWIQTLDEKRHHEGRSNAQVLIAR